MAPGSLPRPGTRYGPCRPPCEHLDCAATRRIAEGNCPTCNEPIGYDKLFYQTDTGYEHAYCLEYRVEHDH